MLKRFTNLFTPSNSLSLKQGECGTWMVKRKYNIVYMGSKEKCMMYLTHLRAV